MNEFISWSDAAALVGGSDVLKAALARMEIGSEVIDGRRVIHRESLDRWLAQPRTTAAVMARGAS